MIPDPLRDGWHHVHTFEIPARAALRLGISDLALHDVARDYISGQYPDGIYGHQHAALAATLASENVCLATSTASGKTLAFVSAAVHHLASNPRSRVLAVYPQRALGVEQEGRWKAALSQAGLDARVCRIDGSVPVSVRPGLLTSSRVVVATPDILHAWLLSSGSVPQVRALLAALALIVVDEVHTYTGVLGSNAAYLFRRLQHVARLRGAKPQVFAASATLGDPGRHLANLFGSEFKVIGPEHDTSPRHPVRISMAIPPRQSDFLTEISDFLVGLAASGDRRFIAFVDSRKQTEHIASILGRTNGGEDGDDHDPGDTPLESAEFLPYRSGYEENDRDRIQRRLSEGSLRGVVSTSALELGLDIPHLNTAVLVGVPRSSTSLQQRIGRIGRIGPGEVIVVNSGDVYDEAVFRRPEQLLSRPPAETALYLENPRIQYIQALCLARLGGEHDQFSGRESRDEEFTSPIDWPEGFLAICRRERTGQIGPELQALKAESGDDPNHVFPLRDVEAQFRIENVLGPNRTRLGSLSYSQLLREAYPGAIYYYATQPYRVASVALSNRTISVRREKRYTTRPTQLPTMVFPNLTHGNVHQGAGWGDLRVLECNLQIRESLAGYRERRGMRETTVTYPLGPSTPGIVYTAARFARLYFTTGVLIMHPSLEVRDVDPEVAAGFIYEALLMAAPFERQDVGYAIDRGRAANPLLAQGRLFIAVYDQTYGSLRLSRRLAEPGMLRQVLVRAVELGENDEAGIIVPRTLEALRSMASAAAGTPLPIGAPFEGGVAGGGSEHVRVIMPGSVGVNLTRGNAEFLVERVLYSPRLESVAYRGRHTTATAVGGQTETIPVSVLVPLNGESQIGYFDPDTGDLTPDGA